MGLTPVASSTRSSKQTVLKPHLPSHLYFFTTTALTSPICSRRRLSTASQPHTNRIPSNQYFEHRLQQRIILIYLISAANHKVPLYVIHLQHLQQAPAYTFPVGGSDSHGHPSNPDSCQEPLVALLHPHRWRSDAFDTLPTYTPHTEF
jgi:hypothetical protein